MSICLVLISHDNNASLYTYSVTFNWLTPTSIYAPTKTKYKKKTFSILLESIENKTYMRKF